MSAWGDLALLLGGLGLGAAEALEGPLHVALHAEEELPALLLQRRLLQHPLLHTDAEGAEGV